MSKARPFSWGITALVAGIINLLINAPIGWGMVKAGTMLPVWGFPGVVPDLVITAYAIGFATAMIVTPQTRKQVAGGKMLPPELSERWRSSFAGWPRSTLARSINLGVLSVLLFVPLPLLALWLGGLAEADRLSVTLIKGGFAFVVGALVTPVIAAAATVSPRAPARAA